MMLLKWMKRLCFFLLGVMNPKLFLFENHLIVLVFMNDFICCLVFWEMLYLF